LCQLRAIEKASKNGFITTDHAYRFVGKPQGSRGNFGAFAFSGHLQNGPFGYKHLFFIEN